jgi:6-phosphogluconolactonase
MNRGPAPRVRVLDSESDVASAGADAFVSAAIKAIAARGRFAVALSGGSTPAGMLGQLSRPEYSDSMDWRHTHVFWSDERCVRPDDPDSNYGMARRALLDKGLIPETNIHRMMGELEPHLGAVDYSMRLRSFFGAPIPTLDLVFLGLGPDGHTASLFPNTDALDVVEMPSAANKVSGDVPSPWRLTLTYPAINSALAVVFLVEGSAKAPILKRVLEGPLDARALPAQGVAPSRGALVWMVDRAAASMLSPVRKP